MSTSDSTTQPTGAQSSGATGGALESNRGSTTIADSVVAKVAGIATREVAGVYDMGAAAGRALGRMTQQVGMGEQRTQGVSVEVGERQAAVDLTLVVEYGESIARVADEVRKNVIRRIEGVTGLEVSEVNVTVNDLHFPGDDQPEEPQESRVE
jgi:uncharacterized alkaline shock family protein YloU